MKKETWEKVLYRVHVDTGYYGSFYTPEELIRSLRDAERLQRSWFDAPIKIIKETILLEDFEYESGTKCIQCLLSEAGATPDAQESCGGTG